MDYIFIATKKNKLFGCIKNNSKNINNKKSKINIFLGVDKTNNNLWLVNIGGYHPFSMQEKHVFG